MTAPALLLAGVAADRASRLPGSLVSASIGLGAGLTAVLGAPEDGSLALFDALVGRVRPRAGRLSVAGREPARDAALRARIGSLGVEEELPALPRVRDVLVLARAPGALAPLGVERLADRRVTSLSYGERRAVELAIALATPSPALVVLVEPYLDVAGVARSTLDEALERTAAVAPVVLITASPTDARRAPRVVVLSRGAFVRGTEGAHEHLGPPLARQLAVWVADGVRAFAAALAPSAAVRSLVFEAQSGDAGVVRALGEDAAAVGLAVADATRASGARVDAVAEVPPELGEVRAMTEWAQRAQHLALRFARSGGAVAPIPGPPPVEPRAPDAPTTEAAAPDAPLPAEPAPGEAPAADVPAADVPAVEAPAADVPAAEASPRPAPADARPDPEEAP